MAEKKLFQSIKEEITILHQVSKIPGCIKLLDIIKDEEGLGLVFPFMRLGDLNNYQKSYGKHVTYPEYGEFKSFTCLEEGTAKLVTFQLVKTFITLHKKGLMHRDFKPENVLVDEVFDRSST